MAQPFTFPPPPPPPPPSTLQNTLPSKDFAGRGRGGRGNYQSFQQNNRGRGQYSARGGQRGAYSNRGSTVSYSRGGNTPSYQQQSCPSRHEDASYTVQKRDHATAFQARPQSTLRNSRPLAPPAVPSFGVDFGAILPQRPELKPDAKQVFPTASTKKTNILGLTPVGPQSDSEEDDGDGDAETKLAGGSPTNINLLQFEYRGQTATLSTPEEVAAWIAERRKRFPTEAKREEAQREAEAKRRKWDEEKAARYEASKVAAKARQEEWQKRKLEKERSQVRQKLLRERVHKIQAKGGDNGHQTVAQAKAEKLKRKAAKIAEQLRAAEAALDEQDKTKVGGLAADDVELDTLLAQVDKIAGAQDESIDLSDIATSGSDTSGSSDTEMIDDTSTSGSSDTGSDLDSAPEQSTSKRTAPDRVLPPARKVPAGTSPASTDNRPLCTNFAKHGRCKYGKKCHFRHDKPDRRNAAQTAPGSRRKGLYQLMVEKEQEEEQRRAVKVIISLGNAGLLDDLPKDSKLS